MPSGTSSRSSSSNAIGAFYDALVKVKGYEAMAITDAAQRVQRSAYAGAYAQHEEIVVIRPSLGDRPAALDQAGG